jgi:lipopolysaccharide export system permease protein
MLMVKPEHMSIRALYEYIHHLHANRQQASRYELALWKKLIYPLSPMIMLLISLPFAYYQARSGKIGGKLMLGLGIGLAFHLIGKASGDLALLKDGTPAMAASLPLLAFGLAGLIALFRVERT